jgi:hypothetical protein
MSAAMPTDPPIPPVKGVAEQPGKRPLTPAAERALAEAAARRAERAPQNGGSQKEAQKEAGGPGGLEPTRYGDWEINGLISDF